MSGCQSTGFSHPSDLDSTTIQSLPTLVWPTGRISVLRPFFLQKRSSDDVVDLNREIAGFEIPT
jgi:hypothetical protein